MQILLYEFITGGGWLLVEPDSRPQGSLLREGSAMLTAVAEDFATLPETEVTVLWDARLRIPQSLERRRNCRFVLIHSPGEHRDQLTACAARADHTLVIAPEFDRHLHAIAAHVAQAGGRLINPDSEFIVLGSDKQQTAEHLSARHVRVPVGKLLEPGEVLPQDFSYPAVVKPCDGAGSMEVQLIATRDAASGSGVVSRRSRIEQFCPGTPASIAALCGPGGVAILPACSQKLTDDGSFAYTGGEVPLRPELAARAKRLGEQAFEALPVTTGYVGLDLVLGEDPAGAGDVVIEVNPRLTTSYVGLRAILNENLAAAMLQTAQGKLPILSLRPGRVEFTSGGDVSHFA